MRSGSIGILIPCEEGNRIAVSVDVRSTGLLRVGCPQSLSASHFRFSASGKECV
jgi:hypothetical protein